MCACAQTSVYRAVVTHPVPSLNQCQSRAPRPLSPSEFCLRSARLLPALVLVLVPMPTCYSLVQPQTRALFSRFPASAFIDPRSSCHLFFSPSHPRHGRIRCVLDGGLEFCQFPLSPALIAFRLTHQSPATQPRLPVPPSPSPQPSASPARTR